MEKSTMNQAQRTYLKKRIEEMAQEAKTELGRKYANTRPGWKEIFATGELSFKPLSRKEVMERAETGNLRYSQLPFTYSETQHDLIKDRIVREANKFNDKIRAKKSKISKEALSAGDKIMVGDAGGALKALADFQRLLNTLTK